MTRESKGSNFVSEAGERLSEAAKRQGEVRGGLQ